MLGWIPILGPIIDGVTSIFKGYFGLREQQVITQGQVDVAATQTAANIIATTKDDIGVRFARDLLIFPPVCWAALIGWDTIMARHSPDLMWHVEKYPDVLAYLPYMSFVFLLGNIGLNIWRNR